MGIEKFGVNDITFLAAPLPYFMSLILRIPPPFLSGVLFEWLHRLALVVKLPHEKFKVANSSPYISEEKNKSLNKGEEGAETMYVQHNVLPSLPSSY